MPITEERMQILKMLEQGRITADEAAKLLAALEIGDKKTGRSDRATAITGPEAKWLRVRITDKASGRQKVSVNLPIGLVNVALKMGAKFAPDVVGLNMTQINEALQNNSQGRIIDVEDDTTNERIEIFVE